MGNCLKKKSAVDVEPPPPPPTAPCYSDTSSSDSETKCKRVRFNTHVEVFGKTSCDHQVLKVEEEEESVQKMEQQVKIRISKKQLEELLQNVEVKSISLDDMMSCLAAEIRRSSKEFS